MVTITYDAPILSLDLGMSTTNKTDGKKKQVPALLQAVSAMTRITGRQPPLPSWTHSGAVLGIQGGQTKVETVVQEAAPTVSPLPEYGCKIGVGPTYSLERTTFRSLVCGGTGNPTRNFTPPGLTGWSTSTRPTACAP